MHCTHNSIFIPSSITEGTHLFHVPSTSHTFAHLHQVSLFTGVYCSMQWKVESAVASASYYLRVHSLSRGSPSALKYPAKQGHSDSPRCVLLLLAGQERQVMFMDRYIPESQPLEGGGREEAVNRWTDGQTSRQGRTHTRATIQGSLKSCVTYTPSTINPSPNTIL